MRIIAGRFGSRRLKPVSGMATRPTPDRLRESLFSVLARRLEGCRFVDAYAGTGAVGLEAVSRGAAHVTLIERSPAALTVLRENVASLGLSAAEVSVVRGSVARILPEVSADILFLDPPYGQPREYELASAALAGAKNAPGLVVVQHASRFALPEEFGDMARTRELRQGDNTLSFFEAKT